MISIFNFLFEFNESDKSNIFKIIKNNNKEDPQDIADSKTLDNLVKNKAVPRSVAAQIDRSAPYQGGVAGAMGQKMDVVKSSDSDQIKQKTKAIKHFNKTFGEKIL